MTGWGRAGLGCLMVVLAVGLLLLVPLANRNPADADATPGRGTPARAATATPTALTVRYYIHGTPNDFQAQISFVDPNGGIQQVGTYQGPWDKVLTMPAGRLAQVMVRELSPGTPDQTIACEIQLNGKPWRTQQAQGAGAQVTCQGVVGEP